MREALGEKTEEWVVKSSQEPEGGGITNAFSVWCSQAINETAQWELKY